MLLWSLDSELLDRNSLSLHPMIDRLASSDIIQVRIEASLRDKLHWCALPGLG